MTEPYALIGKMHQACTQIRLAIAVLEQPEMPEGESTDERLSKAQRLITEVRAEMREIEGVPA